MNEVDNQQSEVTDNLETQAPDTSSNLTQQTEGGDEQDVPRGTTDQVETKPYQPFANGKEKFKVAGKEEEWDWDTAKKYASLGKTAYSKMEEAAQIKKQADAAYSQLLKMAVDDPDGLIRALNPNYNPQRKGQGQSSQTQEQQVTDLDPRDQKIQELERKIGEFNSHLEQQQVEAERKLIAQEIDEAYKKHPALKNELYSMDTLKARYRAALVKGLDVSIDDVAFYLAQEIQEKHKQRTQEKQKSFEQKRKAAPVNAVSAGAESSSKSITIDDVKKLAGRF